MNAFQVGEDRRGATPSAGPMSFGLYPAETGRISCGVYFLIRMFCSASATAFMALDTHSFPAFSSTNFRAGG